MTGTLAYVLSGKYTDEKIAELPVPFKPSGTITFSQLPAAPAVTDLGKIWSISDDFTTDARFIEGPGIAVPAGNTVAVIESNGTYYFDVIPMINLTPLTNGEVDNIWEDN